MKNKTKQKKICFQQSKKKKHTDLTIACCSVCGEDIFV